MNRPAMQKAALIALLAILLLIPVSMIKDLIGERQARRNDAVQAIAQGWGGRQMLSGPYLAIPYEREWTEVVREVKEGKTNERRTERKEALVLRIPADTVAWSVEAATSVRSRGIYEARLYSSRVTVRGTITIPALYGLTEGGSRYRPWVPRLVMGVADPRGIRSVTGLGFGDMKADFRPGSSDAAVASGVHAALPDYSAAEQHTVAFSYSFDLAGSEALSISPLARSTTVQMQSDWRHPSFQGTFLPARHAVRPDGFSAEWQVSQYASQGAARLAGCKSHEPCAAINAQELGVSFIEPVGVYQMLERASKYGFLFIGLVFAAFLLFELLRQLAIHPLQYLMVGLALAIFFLLLTALSEHVSFGAAYAIAALGCVGLITTYLVRAIRDACAGLAFGGALAVLYAVLYVLLKAEDYSLLGGSTLLFLLLAVAMIATRRVDWYRLSAGRGEEARPTAVP